MNAQLALVFSLLALQACTPPAGDSKEPIPLKGAYLGQSLPGDSAVLFAPGLVSGPWAERDMAISPRGDELFYTLVGPRGRVQVITRMKRAGDIWLLPEVAPFSGPYPDLEPAFSPDGDRLYFASKRPLNGQEPAKDWDIWYVQRTGDDWSTAQHVGVPVNTDQDEFFPSIAANGSLYFTATREGGKGREDLYRSTWNGNSYNEPENLGDSINTANYEFNAFVAPDESYLIFSSFGRPDDLGGGDLYISRRRQDGQWAAARNLGPAINSPALDYCPFVSPDGAYFFFSSERSSDTTTGEPRSFAQILDWLNGPGNGNGDVYWVKFGVIR